MARLLERLKNKRNLILETASKYGVSNIRVFGSVARGEEKKDSDIDLLAKISKKSSLFQLVKLELELSKIFGKKIQIVSDRAINRHLKEYILKESIDL